MAQEWTSGIQRWRQLVLQQQQQQSETRQHGQCQAKRLCGMDFYMGGRRTRFTCPPAGLHYTKFKTITDFVLSKLLIIIIVYCSIVYRA